MRAKDLDNKTIVESVFNSYSAKENMLTSEKVKEFVIRKRKEASDQIDKIEKQIIELTEEKKVLEIEVHNQNHVLNSLKITTK